MCCSVLQCVAVRCSVLHVCVMQCVAASGSLDSSRPLPSPHSGACGYVCCSMLQCIAICRSALQCVACRCVAVCCSALQRLAALIAPDTLQHTATHCNTLQHTATHCNTLQHTATHCNTLQHTTPHCITQQHEYSRKSFYGVAVIGRLLQIIGLFCRISSLL